MRLFTATEARDYELLQHEKHKAAFLYLARNAAIKIARQKGVVDINDVRAAVPLPDSMHPSVMGAVFRSKQFKHTGRYVMAQHTASHARKVGVYELTEVNNESR